MKKIVSVVLLAALVLVVFTGCGGGKEADLKAVLSDINAKYAEAAALKELTDVSDLDAYYMIAADDVKQFAAEISTDTSAAPVEIVLVEAVDADAVNNVKTALDRRFNSIVALYTSYSPEDLAVVEACEVTTSGNYVTMVVAEDYSGIIEIVNAAIK